MKTVTIYNLLTGEIARTISIEWDDADEVIRANIGMDEAQMDGAFSAADYYVVDGAAIPFPEPPGDWAEWNWDMHEWTDPRDAQWYAEQDARCWAALRAERDRRLTASDKYALPDYPQTEDQRSAWLAYRQALRDLPENTTDPTAPAWPEEPEAST